MTQAEAFANYDLCYWTWADVLASVKSCEAFFRIMAEKPNCSRHRRAPPRRWTSGRPSSVAWMPESVKLSCLVGSMEWWFGDVASLSPATERSPTNKNLTLTRFPLQYLCRRKADDPRSFARLSFVARRPRDEQGVQEQAGEARGADPGPGHTTSSSPAMAKTRTT